MHSRILNMIATSGFLTALECTKFDFGRCSASDPAEGTYSAPPGPLAGLRGLLLMGGKGKGREKREGKGGEEVGKEQRTGGNGREGIGMAGKGEGKGERRRGGKGRNTPPSILSCLRLGLAHCLFQFSIAASWLYYFKMTTFGATV